MSGWLDIRLVQLAIRVSINNFPPLGIASRAFTARISSVLHNYHPGNKVSISWTDTSGQSHTATVTLGNGPAD